jgi:putative zinc finger/helix-turn-helix YgiT family protein
MSKHVIQLPVLERRVCDCCGAEGVSMTFQSEQFSYKTESGEVAQLAARVPVWTCDACGDQYTDSRAEEIRHESVCRYLGRLAPGEIKELRDALGYSQRDWAELTGFGIASIKRWETGALIQGVAQDRYMRLLRDSRNIVALKAMANGVAAETITKRRLTLRTELAEDTIALAKHFQLRPVGSEAA